MMEPVGASTLGGDGWENERPRTELTILESPRDQGEQTTVPAWW